MLVDNIPIRVMHNRESIGVEFPTRQAMRVYATLWNGDSWATRWGKVKIDISKAPFTASLRNFNANACILSPKVPCRGFNRARNQRLDAPTRNKIKEVQSKWMVYDYCHDFRRYSHGLPYECRRANKLRNQ